VPTRGIIRFPSLMVYQVLADIVACAHAAFVAFVVFGGLLALRWRQLVWLHVPAVIWGALIEFEDWVCPLTPVENALRARAGEAGYGGGFIQHYLLRALYPAGLTRGVQLALGLLVIVVNVSVYVALLRSIASSKAE
jgi:uncharacterized protein DUF2784